MTKVLIIHGFEGSHTGNWFPWLTQELKQKGYEVINESWPNSNHPDSSVVMEFLSKKVKNFTPEDIIIGHSLGAYWALKLAEKLDLAKLILVAPGIGGVDYDLFRREWVGSDINALQRTLSEGFDLSKVSAKEKIAIFSDDDRWIPLSTKDLLDETWDCINLEKRGHIQDKEFPELLDLVCVSQG